MDYKKIIKSRKLRLKLLHLFDFVPDKAMLKIQYRIKTGRRLDLKEPVRFTEKLQWYKLYYRNPVMKKCVDKYDVREYVKQKGWGGILTKCYGIYDSPDQIDFGKLPDSFVIKDTLGGGGNEVIIVEDRQKMDVSGIVETISGWNMGKAAKKSAGREWAYEGRKHRIIIEEYLPSVKEDGGLIDYKFFCFGGKPEYLYVIADRELGEGAGCGIYTENFQKLDVLDCAEKPLRRKIQKPVCYEKMLEIAGKLSEPFPEARIDLYNINGKIFFGEITFYDGSGYICFEPDEFDYEVGKMFQLPMEYKKKK